MCVTGGLKEAPANSISLDNNDKFQTWLTCVEVLPFCRRGVLEAALAASNEMLRHWRGLRLRPAFIFNLSHDTGSVEKTVRRSLKFVWGLRTARCSCVCLPLLLDVSWDLSQSASPDQYLGKKILTFPRRFFSLLY